MLVAAFCGNELFSFRESLGQRRNWEVREGRMPSPARGTRALPRLSRTVGRMTSCISVDFPEPEIPVMTEKRPTGKRTSIFFKLFARALFISIQFSTSRKPRRDPLIGWQSGDFKHRAVSEFGFISMVRSVPLATTWPP